VIALGAKTSFAATADDSARMGQTLFDPPALAGWPAGEAWLGAGAFGQRMRFAQALAAGRSAKLAYALKPRRFVARTLVDSAAIVDAVLAALRLAPSAVSRQALIDYYDGGAGLDETTRFETKLRGLFALALSLPEWQVH
jgi:uncharacterized protein (DUF1800 family)